MKNTEDGINKGKINFFLILNRSNIKLSQQPKYKHWNYKALRKKQVIILHEFEFGNGFIDMTPKVQVTKGKKEINWT